MLANFLCEPFGRFARPEAKDHEDEDDGDEDEDEDDSNDEHAKKPAAEELVHRSLKIPAKAASARVVEPRSPFYPEACKRVAKASGKSHAKSNAKSEESTTKLEEESPKTQPPGRHHRAEALMTGRCKSSKNVSMNPQILAMWADTMHANLFPAGFPKNEASTKPCKNDRISNTEDLHEAVGQAEVDGGAWDYYGEKLGNSSDGCKGRQVQQAPRQSARQWRAWNLST